MRWQGEGDAPYQCAECASAFQRLSDLRRHTITSHRGELLSCTQCVARFTTKRSLRIHTSSVHSFKRVPCLYSGCNATFTRNDNRNAHVKLYHHQADGQNLVVRFLCPKCGKAYATRSYLAMHIASVHEGREYECPSCHKKFNSCGYLRRHYVKEHEQEHSLSLDPSATWAGQQPDSSCKCDLCNRRFVDHASLAVHRHTRHASG